MICGPGAEIWPLRLLNLRRRSSYHRHGKKAQCACSYYYLRNWNLTNDMVNIFITLFLIILSEQLHRILMKVFLISHNNYLVIVTLLYLKYKFYAASTLFSLAQVFNLKSEYSGHNVELIWWQMRRSWTGNFYNFIFELPQLPAVPIHSRKYPPVLVKICSPTYRESLEQNKNLICVTFRKFKYDAHINITENVFIFCR